MAERGTGRYVGSAFITLNREMRERLWKRPGPRRGCSQGHEAAGDAMGQAWRQAAHQASQGRAQAAPCDAAGFR